MLKTNAARIIKHDTEIFHNESRKNIYFEVKRSTRRRHRNSGLLISNIDIDVDSIDDTFDVSISTILLYKSIDRGIDDTLLAFFIDITSILLN